jgi:hypothetical protein
MLVGVLYIRNQLGQFSGEKDPSKRERFAILGAMRGLPKVRNELQRCISGELKSSSKYLPSWLYKFAYGTYLA